MLRPLFTLLFTQKECFYLLHHVSSCICPVGQMAFMFFCVLWQFKRRRKKKKDGRYHFYPINSLSNLKVQSKVILALISSSSGECWCWTSSSLKEMWHQTDVHAYNLKGIFVSSVFTCVLNIVLSAKFFKKGSKNKPSIRKSSFWISWDRQNNCGFKKDAKSPKKETSPLFL